MTIRQTIGHVLAIALALLWAFASQAHFTDRLTPDMFRSVDRDIKGLHKAFKSTGLSQEQVKYIFGALGFFAAYLLLRRSTRALGLMVAMAVTVVGRIYPQVVVKSLEGGNLVLPTALLIVTAFALGLVS